MEKQVKSFDVKYDLDWGYSIEISRLREDLDELEKLGTTHIEIEANIFYDDVELTIEAKRQRLETDEEFKERKKAIKKREEQAKERKLLEFERLKKELGK